MGAVFVAQSARTLGSTAVFPQRRVYSHVRKVNEWFSPLGGIIGGRVKLDYWDRNKIWARDRLCQGALLAVLTISFGSPNKLGSQHVLARDASCGHSKF